MHPRSHPYLLAPFVALGLAWPQAAGGGYAQRTEPVAATEASAAVFEEVLPGDLWAHPSRFLGRRVLITIQVHSHPETWNPFLTRFGPGEFACVRGWSDQQQPWIEEQFNAPRVRVFARRGSAADWALEEAPRYQRFELSCEVRAVFGDSPWLEVVGVKPLIRKLGDGVLLHAVRGLDFMDKKLWDVARLELERATGGALPKPALEEFRRLMEICEQEMEEPVLLPYEPYEKK